MSEVLFITLHAWRWSFSTVPGEITQQGCYIILYSLHKPSQTIALQFLRRIFLNHLRYKTTIELLIKPVPYHPPFSMVV